MARPKEKIATCPVCGTQEMAVDKATLMEALQEHLHQFHNLNYPLKEIEAQIKETGLEDSSDQPITVPLKGESSDGLVVGPDFGGGNRTGE